MKSALFSLVGRGIVATALLAGLFGMTASASPTDTVSWSFGPPSPFAFTRFDGQLVPGKGVIFLGGRLADNSTDGTIWMFSGGAYTVTGTIMPVPISNYEIAMLKDPTSAHALYVFGGRDNNGNIINTVQVYYPSTNTAMTVPSDPWPGTTPSGCISLPAMGVATVGNVAIVMGGASFSTSVPACVDDNSAQTWVFNPMAPAGSRWSPGPTLNMARGYITAATLGTKVYAIGGDVNSAGTLFAQTTVEVWDTAGANSWSLVAPLPEPCDESQAFGFTRGSLTNQIILAGCGQWPNALADTWQYDSTADTWTAGGPLNIARRNQAGALMPARGGLMYVLGGYNRNGGLVLNSSEVASFGSSMPRPDGGVPVTGPVTNN